MNADPDMRLSRLQLAVLRSLWQRREATVTDVQSDLLSARSLAVTTVATLLKRLAARGIVAHRTEGRQFIYRALIDEESVAASMTSDLVEDLYEGDVAGLFAHLLDPDRVTDRDLKRIKRLIRQAEKRG
jgi:predicted transcriptional regulator